MESMDIILDSKGFAQCNTCDRVFRPWHLGTVYEPTKDGKHKHPKGYCPHCQALMNYTIRDYTDEEMSTIEDIVRIKKVENKAIKELFPTPKKVVKTKNRDKLWQNIARFSAIFILFQWFGMFMLFVVTDTEFSWFGMGPDVSFYAFLFSGGIAFWLMGYFINRNELNEDNRA